MISYNGTKGPCRNLDQTFVYIPDGKLPNDTSVQVSTKSIIQHLGRETFPEQQGREFHDMAHRVHVSSWIQNVCHPTLGTTDQGYHDRPKSLWNTICRRSTLSDLKKWAIRPIRDTGPNIPDHLKWHTSFQENE